MKPRETMRERWIKSIKGEITQEQFLKEYCSSIRWYDIQRSFNIELDSFPNLTIWTYIYDAKKYGGAKAGWDIGYVLDMLTGQWHIEIKCHGWYDLCILEYNFNIDRSDIIIPRKEHQTLICNHSLATGKK